MLKLTTWERIKLAVILGEIKGTLALLRKAGKALDALELSDEEREAVAFNVIMKPEGGISYQWDERAHPEPWEVEIGDREVLSLVQRMMTSYEGWSMAELEQAEALTAKLEAG